MTHLLLNISLVAILTALFRMLIPDNTLKKQISFFISCFFISAVFSFVTGSVETDDMSDLLTPQTSYVDFSRTYIDSVGENAAKNMSYKIKSLLGEYGIYPEQVYVIVNISDNMSISIVKTELVFAEESADMADFAVELVKRNVGDDIQVAAVTE